ncbi:MAG: biotin/lipoyl-containing protein, partial [Rubrivivax sp.]|nr:biotin/lipoyl-containing protein [Rubrivivax sp.]
VDANLKHHFLEMNTRLQVEHPVTECITGLDLVEWQLRVARGEPLPLTQEQITFTGHAIEARLYAEDPYDGWKPQTGRVAGWQPDSTDVRIDHGIAEGGEVTPYYDAMVAKFVAHGSDREDAIRRLTRALEDVPLLGLQNNGRFLRDLLKHPQFSAAELSTTRLDEWAAQGEPLLQRPTPPDAAWRIAAALLAGQGGQRPASVSAFDLTLQCQGENRTQRAPDAAVQVLAWNGQHAQVGIDGVQCRITALQDGTRLHLCLDGAVFSFEEPSAYPKTDSAADPRRARAPVAGVVAQVSVLVGDTVVAGQPLVCVEAMKMEMWVNSAAAGSVKSVNVKPKDPVAAGAVLVELEIAE